MHNAALLIFCLACFSYARRIQFTQGNHLRLSGREEDRDKSAASWSIACEVEDLELKINGKVVTVEEAKAFGGRSFVMQVGPNLVEFADKGPSGVEITLNRSPEKHLKIGKVLLHFNRYACCVGDQCVMWPKAIPEGGWELPSVVPGCDLTTDGCEGHSRNSSASWSLDCHVEDLQLKIDGIVVSASQANELGGTTFAMEVGSNLVEFEDKGPAGVEITLNRSPPTHEKSGKVELHFSKHACCVGDKCVMWPKTIPAEGWRLPPATLPTEAAEDRESFLRRMREKLGDDDFNQLLSFVGSTTESTAKSMIEEEPLHSDKVKELHSEHELQYLLEAAGDRMVVLDFWAPWCVPCKRFAPFFYTQAEDIANVDVVFGKLNIQETNALSRLARDVWGVETLPSVLFIKNGKVVNRLGSASSEDFLTLLAESKDAVSAEAQDFQLKSEQRPIEYDLVVIGGGSGGLAAAKEAANIGARVALFDFVQPSPHGAHWGFGGTCVNVGCVPKKLMHYAALTGEASRDARVLGWNVPDRPSHNWAKMVTAVQAHVKKLNFFYENGVKAPKANSDGSLPHAGVWYYNAFARFDSAEEVSWRDSLGKEGVVRGKQFIVATGCRPWVPDIPGKELAITSDDLFSLKHSPGKVLVVGGGYIALEAGGFLTNLGYETHIAVRSAPLRVGFDKDAAAMAVELMRLQGTKFWLGWNIKSLQQDGAKIRVTMYNDAGEDIMLFDTVLYAVGRSCNTAVLNLNAVGVKTNQGKVEVDDEERTSAGNIYAIGDVADRSLSSNSVNFELSPVAIQSGEMLVRRLFNGSTTLMDYKNIPTTVFTPFEIGSVGLPEHVAVEEYGLDNVETYIKVYESLEMSAVHRHTEVSYMELDWDEVKKKHVESKRQTREFPPNAMAKLVCLKSERSRVIGFHYVGPNAGEVTQGFSVAMRLGATKADFDATVGIHPTNAESFTMLETTRSSGKNWIAAGGCGGGKCG